MTALQLGDRLLLSVKLLQYLLLWHLGRPIDRPGHELAWQSLEKNEGRDFRAPVSPFHLDTWVPVCVGAFCSVVVVVCGASCLFV